MKTTILNGNAVVRRMKNGYTAAPSYAHIERTERTESVKFEDAMRAYESAPSAENLWTFAKAITFAAVRKIEDASANESIRLIRNDTIRDAHAAERTDSNAFDAYGDGIDLIMVAALAILTERENIPENGNYETPYIKRELSKRVLIKDDDSAAWRENETCAVSESFRAVRRAIDASRHAVADVRSKYMYIADVAKDAESESDALETVYRRMPRYYQLTAECDMSGRALCNVAPSVNHGLIEDVASTLAALKLTTKQTKIIEYRMRGYGYDSIATYLDTSKGNVSGQCTEIRRKFEHMFFDRAAAAAEIESKARRDAAAAVRVWREKNAAAKAERDAVKKYRFHAAAATVAEHAAERAERAAERAAARVEHYSKRTAAERLTAARDAAARAAERAAAERAESERLSAAAATAKRDARAACKANAASIATVKALGKKAAESAATAKRAYVAAARAAAVARRAKNAEIDATKAAKRAAVAAAHRRNAATVAAARAAERAAMRAAALSEKAAKLAAKRAKRAAAAKRLAARAAARARARAAECTAARAEIERARAVAAAAIENAKTAAKNSEIERRNIDILESWRAERDAYAIAPTLNYKDAEKAKKAAKSAAEKAKKAKDAAEDAERSKAKDAAAKAERAERAAARAAAVAKAAEIAERAERAERAESERVAPRELSAAEHAERDAERAEIDAKYAAAEREFIALRAKHAAAAVRTTAEIATERAERAERAAERAAARVEHYSKRTAAAVVVCFDPYAKAAARDAAARAVAAHAATVAAARAAAERAAERAAAHAATAERAESAAKA